MRTFIHIDFLNKLELFNSHELKEKRTKFLPSRRTLGLRPGSKDRKKIKRRLGGMLLIENTKSLRLRLSSIFRFPR